MSPAGESAQRVDVQAARQVAQLDESIGDKELFVFIQAGRADAWALLVGRYKRVIYSVARANGLSTDDAMDVTQSTFVALLESLGSLRESDRLGWWLMTVARRQSWRVRNRSRRETLQPEVLVVEQSGEDWDATIALHQAVNDLQQPCRDLISALFFDPMRPSYEQIAQRMGRSVGGIGPLRGRCIGRLRDQLSKGELL